MIDAIKQAQRGAVIMAMAALPVVVLGLLGSLSPRDRYWGSVYVVWGTVFAALCVVATSRIVRRAEASDSRLTKKDLCFGGMTAWGLSLPVLVLTTLTPLCLGQDNGDGRNNVAMCLFLAVVWFIVMSLPVCGAIVLLAKWACNAVSASSCVETRRRDENKTCQPSPPQTPAMRRRRLALLGLSLAVNIFLCCTLLPFAIPPFVDNSISKVPEVLLWQSIGSVGWPFALLGLIISIPFGARPASVAALLPMLTYPVIQFLLIRSVIARMPRCLDVILLHIFVIVSFIVVWHFVLNGYDFMAG